MEIPWFNIPEPTTIEIVIFFLLIIFIISIFPISLILYKNHFGKFSANQIQFVNKFLSKKGVSQDGINIFINILKKENIYFGRILNNNSLAVEIIIKNIYMYTVGKTDKEAIAIKNQLYHILDIITSFYKSKNKYFNSRSLDLGLDLWLKKGKSAYYSLLKKVTEDYIEIDADQIMLEELSVDDELEVNFFIKNDSGYSFQTRIIKIAKKKNIILLSHSEYIKRHQMRKHLRKSCDILVNMYSVSIEEQDSKKKVVIGDKLLSGTIKDISIGGLKVSYDTEFEDRYKYYYLSFIINQEEIHSIVKLNFKQDGFLHLQFLKIFKNKQYLINDYIFSDIYQKIIEEKDFINDN